ncbi:hypothetical protein GUITHDRAFT_112165 [Guillardia theta CCMP2712]|uniref:GT23 domain-containing protein n=1 Tax=Guillardia theta (strain CCMP2712) TaxID=905079 RepID=L1J0Y1_GUITC|nr:hypothetical protein GUITHDRAFT_112165 [Guillardia theta CCMP2712]EKX41750.1 hypothetical protein GUITHDRAFT_112165 [Guillardia theta CCMP2712]|eukprot:XP_005828730.1 hypothetical protein GUITHDRAFT_112165 [Guillardia theta CCMP2712]
MAIAARLPPLLLLSVLLLLHFHVSLAPTPKEEDEEDERIVRGILVCNLVLSGFFAHLSYVTNMVRYARHLGMKPFFFLHGGNFWEETYGDNWIEYFFTQPMVSEREREAIRRKVLAPYLDKDDEDLARGEVEHVEEEQRRYEETVVIPRKLRNLSSDHDIVTSFLQPKRWVLEQVQSYVERVFGGKHVLGVHYRGLDKSGRSRGEAPRVPWDEVLRAIERYRKHFPSSLVYVATDERRFIEFLSKRLPPGAMVTQEGFLRSEDAGGDAMPLWAWEFEGSPMRKGQEALVESLVLSRTSFLLRTSSLLSAFAKIFNPKLPVLLLNRQVDDFAPENYMQDDELPFPPDDVEKGRGEGGEDQEEGGAGEKAEGRQRTLEEAMDRLKSVGEEEFSLQEVDGGRRDLYLKQSNASQKIVNIVWLGRTISSPSRFYVQQTVLPQDRAWRTSWVEVERGNFSYGSFASGDVIMVICGEMGERRKNKSKASFLQRLRSWSLARGEEDASAALLVPCGPADGKYLESSESLATELVGLVDAVALLSTQLSCAEEVRGNRSTAVVRLLLGFSDMTQLVQLHSLLPAPQRQNLAHQQVTGATRLSDNL